MIAGPPSARAGVDRSRATALRFGLLLALAGTVDGPMGVTLAFAQGQAPTQTDLPGAAAAVQKESEKSFVELTVVGAPADLQRVRSVIEPWPLVGSDPHWLRAGSFNPIEILQTIHDVRARPVVRCWIDVTDQARARLYFAARSGQQFLVRDVELSSNFDELDRESLSNVLELSIKALIDDEAVGLTREQARAVLSSRPPTVERPANPSRAADAPEPPASLDEESPAQPAAPPPVASPEPAVGRGAPSVSAARTLGADLRFGASGFYAVQSLGGGLPFSHGPGVLLELGRDRAGPVLGLFLSGQYRWPVHLSGPAASADVQTVAARAGLAGAVPLGSFHLGGRLGAGVDATHLSPQPGSVDPTATLTSQRWLSTFAVTASVGVWKRFGASWWGGVEILADALPAPVSYQQRVSDVTTGVATPAHLQPGVELEIGFR